MGKDEFYEQQAKEAAQAAREAQEAELERLRQRAALADRLAEDMKKATDPNGS